MSIWLVSVRTVHVSLNQREILLALGWFRGELKSEVNSNGTVAWRRFGTWRINLAAPAPFIKTRFCNGVFYFFLIKKIIREHPHPRPHLLFLEAPHPVTYPCGDKKALPPHLPRVSAEGLSTFRTRQGSTEAFWGLSLSSGPMPSPPRPPTPWRTFYNKRAHGSPTLRLLPG